MPENEETSDAAAEQRVAEAQQALDEAKAQLVEAQGELRATVSRDVPQMVVEVLPGNHISHEGQDYYGEDYPLEHGESAGSEFTLDGPTAIALVMAGQVRIVSSE